ncbi:MAG: hypothetical protein NVSMB13_16300 [Mycobacteriales bacterium]
MVSLLLCLAAGLLVAFSADQRLLRAATVLALAAVVVTGLSRNRPSAVPAPRHGADDGVRRELAALREALTVLGARIEVLAGAASTAQLPAPGVPAVLATPSSALLLPLVRAALLETALSSNGNGHANGNGHRVVTLPESAELTTNR